MKYYDARIIEGCCVFSYEVKMPQRLPKNGEKKKKRSSHAWRKAMLRFLLLLLMPLAALGDGAEKCARALSRQCRALADCCAGCRGICVCVVSSVSTTALIPLVLILL